MKKMVLLITLLSFLLTGCFVADMVPQSNDVLVLNSNAKLNKNKRIAVILNYPRLTTKEHYEYRNTYVKTALDEVGLNDYLILDKGHNTIPDTCEYFLTIDVEELYIAKHRPGTIGVRDFFGSVTATVFDSSAEQVLIKVTGDAHDGKFFTNMGQPSLADVFESLLVEILEKMYL